MSGGHFGYQDRHLEDIVEQLDKDIEYNVHKLQPETIEYLKRMSSDLDVLRVLLNEYDLAVCGDTSEEKFLENARPIYQELCEEDEP